MLRQTRLTEFLESILHIYVPVNRYMQKRRGLSEKVLGKRLVKKGWLVWRSEFINILDRPENYPVVKKKYFLLKQLLNKYHPGTYEHLKYIAIVHHGLPDFLCFRLGQFKFVECKLEHEQLSNSQKKCIPLLQKLGFVVEVHKLVSHATKIRKAKIDLISGNKYIIDRQLKLTKKLMKI